MTPIVHAVQREEVTFASLASCCKASVLLKSRAISCRAATTSSSWLSKACCYMQGISSQWHCALQNSYLLLHGSKVHVLDNTLLQPHRCQEGTYSTIKNCSHVVCAQRQSQLAAACSYALPPPLVGACLGTTVALALAGEAEDPAMTSTHVSTRTSMVGTQGEPTLI